MFFKNAAQTSAEIRKKISSCKYYKGYQGIKIQNGTGTWFEGLQACSDVGGLQKISGLTESQQLMKKHGITSQWVNIKSNTRLQWQDETTNESKIIFFSINQHPHST